MRWNIKNKKIQHNIDKPKYKNPLFSNEKITTENFNLGLIGYILLLIIFIIIYFFIYSPYFFINRIEYRNLHNISPIKLTEDYVKPQLNSYNNIITRQINLFSFDKNELIHNISSEYNLENIEIDKKMPNQIIIKITEKTPSLIYKNQDNMYYLDENGTISKKLSQDEIKNENNLPIITNLSNQDTNIGQNIIDKSKFDTIKKIISETENYKRISVKNYEIPVLLSTQFNILTEDGYKIFFDTSKDIDVQFNRLKRVLEESDLESTPQEYIDLRIGERVYIK